MRRALVVVALCAAGCVDFGSYRALDDAAVQNGDGGGCVPATCQSMGKNCDTVDDGCGTKLACGNCSVPATCGGGGTPNVCGCAADPMTCAGKCGMLVDKCGTTVDCGNCAMGLNCGGGGPNICGKNICTPTTCMAEGKNCDSINDNCGKILNCGSCTLPQTCGGGGTANVCGCIPTSCAAQNKNCGPIFDGCGNMLDCGTCADGIMCLNNVCNCTPIGCDANGCGKISDGCGHTVDCGGCKNGQSCIDGVCTTYTCTSKAQVCDPVCNTGCGNGERCDVYDVNQGQCIPQDNGGVGNNCTVDMNSDTCGPKLICLDTCFRLCYSDADCQADACCDSPIQFDDGTDSGFKSCSPSDGCDPSVMNSCPNGQACYFSTCPNSPGGSGCTSQIGKTQIGQACTYTNDCVPGTSCSQEDKKCYPVCKLAAPSCAQGKVCTQAKMMNGKFAITYGFCK
jgi:hypothetical protein